MFSGFGSNIFGNSSFNNTKFEEFFRCYPIAMMPDLIRKDDANYGGKIFLPPSALNKLTMLHIRYPMLFELHNEDKMTHSGVLEFIAEEGRCYIPQWMMNTLQLNPGGLIKINNCDLQLGKFVKIEPQSVDFLDISDPRAVLENVFRKFSTLTVGDVIEINYNDSIYGIKVLEVKPESGNMGICVVETDLVTDFAPPVGYVEPEYKPKAVNKPNNNNNVAVSKSAGAGTMAKSINYANIVGEASTNGKSGGQKLSGKAIEEKIHHIDDLDINAPPAPLQLPDNQLFFGFPVILPKQEQTNEQSEQTSPEVFSGTGQTLRQSKKRKDKTTSFPSLKNHSRSPPEIIEID
ncbi:Ubiquitin fusion degradation protein 1 [Spathaspora sp. JA1]|nr:Ubiquitin fusion degradation protein 1 [Spathaspora sp. JA1]